MSSKRIRIFMMFVLPIALLGMLFFAWRLMAGNGTINDSVSVNVQTSASPNTGDMLALVVDVSKSVLDLLFNDPNLGSTLGKLLLVLIGYVLANRWWGDGKYITRIIRLAAIFAAIACVYFSIPVAATYIDVIANGTRSFVSDTWKLANLNNFNRGVGVLVMLAILSVVVVLHMQNKFGSRLGVAIASVLIILTGLAFAQAGFHSISTITRQIENVGGGGVLIDP